MTKKTTKNRVTNEPPILFSSEMVRSILSGRKTQTRRIVTANNSTVNGWPAGSMWNKLSFDKAVIKAKSDLMVVLLGEANAEPDVHILAPVESDEAWHRVRPKYEVGMNLWVKEGHYRNGQWFKNGMSKSGKQKWRFESESNAPERICFECPEHLAKRPESGWYKRSSLFMPHWASRITLKIESVRVERLQEISAVDAIAEGMHLNGAGWHWNKNEPYSTCYGFAIAAYKALWESINGKGSWALNPYVWKLEFSVTKQKGTK